MTHAADEDYWSGVQALFDVDRSVVFLDSAAMSVPVRLAVTAARRFFDYETGAPPYTIKTVLRPQLESVRERIATLFGCMPDELAIVRNATEAMDICIAGTALSAGDEIVLTDQDFPSITAACDQRATLDGVVVRKVHIPVPYAGDDDFCDRLRAEITPRTKLITISHMTSTVGQTLPIARVAAIAGECGIPFYADGAQSFAHVPTENARCANAFGTSLHKWLCAPPGTGLLFVRSDSLDRIAPLFAPTRNAHGARRYEQFGAVDIAPFLGIAESVAVQEAIGTARKRDRLRYLTMRWIITLQDHARFRLLTRIDDRDPVGIATFAVEGLAPADLVSALWTQHRILVASLVTPTVQGVRVSVNVYTTLREVDIFIDAVRAIMAV